MFVAAGCKLLHPSALSPVYQRTSACHADSDIDGLILLD
jgi:hypothetical protein